MRDRWIITYQFHGQWTGVTSEFGRHGHLTKGAARRCARRWKRAIRFDPRCDSITIERAR